MAGLRRWRLAALFVGLLPAAASCAIDLSDSLEGRPCKNGDCLTGYRCDTARNVCVLEGASSGGQSSSAEAGTGGAGAGGAQAGGATASGGSASGGSDDAGLDGPPDSATGAGGAVPPSDSGTGGTSGADAGTGGAPDGGDAEAGTGGAGAGGAGAGGAGALIKCRTESCSGGDLCCVATFPGFPTVPDPDDFSCQADSDGCQYALKCDGNEDCSGGKICCATNASGDWLASCIGSGACVGSSVVQLGCGGPSQCGAGERCCATLAAVGRYSRLRCAATCTSGEYVFCDRDADCNGTGTCQESAVLPGFKNCR